VAYPFGFGLSYTTFSYGQATATASPDGIEVRVPVTNAGDRDGREVVQVYAGLPGSRVSRAKRELKAFASVPITAGETVEVVLTIDRDDLAYWDTMLNRWVVEGGQYQCAVGASSRDLRGTVAVEVPGDDARVPLTADSTLGEWLADPRGAQAIGQAFGALPGDDSGPMAAFFADPTMMLFLSGTPLARMTAFPGSPLTAEGVAKLVADVNGWPAHP
jgi:beta-glucosidase